MTSAAQIDKAHRIVGAIDKRIDAVRAEMCRKANLDPDAFDYDAPEGLMAACRAFGNARRDIPGYDGIEASLFLRRGDATDIRDRLIAKAEKAAERRELRERMKQHQLSRHDCPTCGFTHLAA